MARLDGLGVLVTRPALQAVNLCDQLKDLGAQVHPLPAIELRPSAPLDQLRSTLGPIEAFDWIVFVSANAVRFGSTLLDPAHPRPLIAIGPATARALEAAGFPVTLVPAQGYDSEQLLSMAPLQAIAGQRVLIVRGDDGRALLADTLRARGAIVVCANVYERHCVCHPPAVIEALEGRWRDGAIGVVTVTSGELLKCLDTTLSPLGRALLRTTPLLVGGARIESIARDLGVTAPLIVAARPDDLGLIEALQSWYAHRP